MAGVSATGRCDNITIATDQVPTTSIKVIHSCTLLLRVLDQPHNLATLAFVTIMVHTEAKCLCGASRISWDAEPSFKVYTHSAHPLAHH
jgi:hypothetical protein